MSNDVWSLDPLWLAQQVNADVDITNFGEVTKCCNVYLESFKIVTTNSGSCYINYNTLKETKTDKELMRPKELKTLNLIKYNGQEPVTNMSAYFTSNWEKNNATYGLFGPYIVCLTELCNIETIIKQRFPDHAKSVPEDIEYIDS